MPRRIWEKAERGFLSDAAGLLSLGGIALLRGYSYLPMNVNVDRAPAHFLEGLLSPPVWAAVWIAIGILCIVPIWIPRLLPLAVGVGVGLHVLWLISFMGVQISGENSRAYVSSINYYAVAFFVAWGFGRGREIAPVRIEKE